MLGFAPTASVPVAALTDLSVAAPLVVNFTARVGYAYGPPRREKFQGVLSIITAVGDTVVVSGLDSTKPHCFVGAQFFSDSAGLNKVVPTAGTITIDIETFNSTPALEQPQTPTIDATAPSTISWSANTFAVRGTPAGIVGANFYRLIVSCNES